jgi:membrane protease YdiL (CAAX protease family)
VEQDNLPPVPDRPAIEETSARPPAPEEHSEIGWPFIGENGLRAGWSILIFALLFFILNFFFLAFAALVVGNFGHGMPGTGSALAEGVGELAWFLAMIVTAAVIGLMERRSILDYNLKGPHRTRNFFAGCLAGFAALSVLVGGLAAGGWLHFGPVALSGISILKFAALWGITFLLVGCVEEGLFRCYLQFTLTRGINFWWALILVTCICLYLGWTAAGNGRWGVYIVAILGLLPCFALQWLRAESAGFWQAAWVTSTFFGFIHTGNNGENWIGVFAAAAIGFVFCVSVWVTGSAWWAIGCHFAWDWAETYFYGTADSGLPAQGHLLSTSPAGNVLWSGGSDGPEGSLLVLAAILLLLVALLVAYRRKRPSPASSESVELRSA